MEISVWIAYLSSRIPEVRQPPQDWAYKSLKLNLSDLVVIDRSILGDFKGDLISTAGPQGQGWN